VARQRFPTRIDPRYAALLRVLFGVTPENSYVELTDAPVGDADGTGAPAGMFFARYGRFHAETPIANIVSWRIEGPWRAITALGVRMSVRHRDLTFGGTARGGVRVDFRERPKVSVMHPPALYVTVDDLEGLAAALTARGIPGEDARTRIVS
jgi:hypothetical protein